MQRALLRAAAILIIASGLVLGGYWIYVFFEALFESNEVPFIIRLFVVAGGLGFALLFLYIVWDRIRQLKGEDFRDRH